jgi:hypothetical protein
VRGSIKPTQLEIKMKRDLDVLRAALLLIEGGEYGKVTIDDLRHKADCSPRSARYHCWLLVDGGYAKTAQEYSDEVGELTPQALTSKGHDLCEWLRDDEVWATARGSYLAHADDATIEWTADRIRAVFQSGLRAVA